jgi:hypothetical protein
VARPAARAPPRAWDQFAFYEIGLDHVTVRDAASDLVLF